MDKLLKNTTFVRIVALCLGTLLWFVVHLEESTPNSEVSLFQDQRIVNVSITPTNVDESQYYIKEITPSTVEIVLRGKKTSLSRVNPTNYKVVMDLSRVKAGKQNVLLQPINFPSGVKVDVYPSSVMVTVEEKQKKEVPVTIILKGEPSKGYKAGDPIIRPNKVHVTVPSSQMDQIASVKGEVDVDNAESALLKQVKLNAYDKNGNIVDAVINPQVVDVEVPITRPIKTMPLQIKLAGQTPKGFSIVSLTQSVDQITVYGQQKLLDAFEYYEGPQIDLSTLTENQVLTLEIPVAKGIDRIEPTKVDIDVKIVPSEYKELKQVPITIVGKNDQYKTSIIAPQTTKLDLTVEGAPALLNQLKVADVQAFVDVSNLPPGTHTLPIHFNLPIFLKGQGSETSVTIVIEAENVETQAVPFQPVGDDKPVAVKP